MHDRHALYSIENMSYNNYSVFFEHIVLTLAYILMHPNI